MKCCHLVAALALVGCGLNTSALPGKGGAVDAGVSSDTAREQSLAGSPATWPTRRRPSQVDQDGGSSDTKDAAGGSANNGRDAQSDPADSGGQTNPGGSSNPAGGQSPNDGSSKPGGQAQPSSGSPGSGSASPSGTNGSSGSSTQGAGAPDAGWSAPDEPDDDDSSDEDNASDKDDEDKGSGSNGNGGQSSGGNGNDNGGQSSGGNGGQQSNNADAVSVIVDLVIAILDLSLGPIRPAEIEALVSAILVLSLAPADLAAESLIAVLDALEDTRICVDHPERCNPLCTNLESDCSACGHDHDCIERIEEMCQVRLPKTCL